MNEYSQVKGFKSLFWGRLESKMNKYFEKNSAKVVWVESISKFSILSILTLGLLDSKSVMVYYNI